MIDLNKIRSMKVLENLKADLTEFINFDKNALVTVYDSEDLGDEGDLDADIEAAQDLLSKIERRMKSLGNHLAKVDKNAPPKSSTPETSGDSVAAS